MLGVPEKYLEYPHSTATARAAMCQRYVYLKRTGFLRQVVLCDVIYSVLELDHSLKCGITPRCAAIDVTRCDHDAGLFD